MQDTARPLPSRVLSGPPRPAHPRRWAAVAGLVGALLVGCGATNNSSTDSGTAATALTDPITFQTTTMPVAYLGESFTSNIAVMGGVGPYGYRVVSGSLPPGIKLSGTSLSGTPSAAGAYQFTVEASDANLSTRVKQYTLNVNDLPPLSLEPELPAGQVRGETRVPVQIKAARKVRAARLVWDLGKDVKVTRVQATDPTNAVFWSQSGQIVTVDLGFKTVPRSDTRVALLTVKPAQPVTLSTTNFWYESRDGQGKLISGRVRPAATLPSTTGGAADSLTAPGSSAAPASAAPASTAPVLTPPALSPSQTPGSVRPAAPAPVQKPAPGPTTPGPTTPGTTRPGSAPVSPPSTPPAAPTPVKGGGVK